jgi:hypothetical protein
VLGFPDTKSLCGAGDNDEVANMKKKFDNILNAMLNIIISV